MVANPVGGVVFLSGGERGQGRAAVGRSAGAQAEDFGAPPPGLDEGGGGGASASKGGEDDIPF